MKIILSILCLCISLSVSAELRDPNNVLGIMDEFYQHPDFDEVYRLGDRIVYLDRICYALPRNQSCEKSLVEMKVVGKNSERAVIYDSSNGKNITLTRDAYNWASGNPLRLAFGNPAMARAMRIGGTGNGVITTLLFATLEQVDFLGARRPRLKVFARRTIEGGSQDSHVFVVYDFYRGVSALTQMGRMMATTEQASLENTVLAEQRKELEEE